MLSVFKSDSVLVEYIDQERCFDLFHVTSMGVNHVNDVHTVESNGWRFKARPLEKDTHVLQGFLLYHARLSCKMNWSLNESNVKTLITNHFLSHWYLSSLDYHIDMLVVGFWSKNNSVLQRNGWCWFISYWASAYLCFTDVISTCYFYRNKDAVPDMTLYNENLKDTLFVESCYWCALDEME